MWKSGSGSQKRSASVNSRRSRQAATEVRTSASWLRGQPLGSAVVPEVYIMTATSRRRTRERARCTAASSMASPAAPKASRPIMPAGMESPSSATVRSRGAASSARAAGSGAPASPGRARWSSAAKSTCSSMMSLVSSTVRSASRTTWASSRSL